MSTPTPTIPSSLRLSSPVTGRELRYDAQAAAYVSSDGGERYAVNDRVVRMLDQDDAFYEGAYLNRVAYLPSRDALPFVLPLWLVNSGYVWEVARRVPSGSTVIELGPAGGVAYFGMRYLMLGIDLSASALRKVTEVYPLGVQADAAVHLPLPDASVDAVVSSYFWEHISPHDKPALLRQCHRVLKPGGKLVFLYDVATRNPLIAHYRARDPQLYDDQFLATDGHIGYQSPADNAALFREAGFALQVHKGMERSFVLAPTTFQKLSSWPGAARPLLRAATRLGRQPFFYVYTALIRVTDETWGRALPMDWSRIVLTVAEKRER